MKWDALGVLQDTVDLTDNERVTKREYMYIIVTVDRFYVLPRSFLTDKLSRQGRPTHRQPSAVTMDDVIEMEHVLVPSPSNCSKPYT